jgi:hypothetical protein
VVVREFRGYWPKPAFWLSIGILVSAHLAVYSAALLAIDHWRTIWFALVAGAELPLLLGLLWRLGYRPTTTRRQARRQS